MEDINDYHSEEVSHCLSSRFICLTLRYRLHTIGAVKGPLRDIAWNLVAWASFTAVSPS